MSTTLADWTQLAASITTNLCAMTSQWTNNKQWEIRHFVQGWRIGEYQSKTPAGSRGSLVRVRVQSLPKNLGLGTNPQKQTASGHVCPLCPSLDQPLHTKCTTNLISLELVIVTLYSNGQAIKFSSGDLFFSRSNLWGQRMPPCRTFTRMSECGVIL